MSAANRGPRPAFNKLADGNWCVPFGRRLVVSQASTGALIAFGAVCAWRDRGPIWGQRHKENEKIQRESAQKPPGGWAALAGTSRGTWKRWQDEAIKRRLLKRRTGIHDRRSEQVQLLRPVAAERKDGEQFARVPVFVLFNPEISRAAKRIYMVLALHRPALPRVVLQIAVSTIEKGTGFDRRQVQRGLRELEVAGAIEAVSGRVGRVRAYRLPERGAVKTSLSCNQQERQETTAPPQQERHKTTAPLSQNYRPPSQETTAPNVAKLPPNSGVSSRSLFQESDSGCAEPASPPPAPDPPKFTREEAEAKLAELRERITGLEGFTFAASAKARCQAELAAWERRLAEMDAA